MTHSTPDESPTPFDDQSDANTGVPEDQGADQSAAGQALAEAREEVLRTRADMDNLRKRLARELDTTRRVAAERVLADLLPVIDSLEQGLGALPENDPSREGLTLTHRQLVAALEKHGLIAIDPVGQVFDPAEHQAISVQATDLHPANTVLTVLQKGYRLHERVLRPAMVIVSDSGA